MNFTEQEIKRADAFAAYFTACVGALFFAAVFVTFIS